MILTYENVNRLSNKEKKEIRNWRNQDFVRAHMFKTAIIKEDEHEAFVRKLELNQEYRMYRVALDGRIIGIATITTLTDGSIIYGSYLTHEEDMNSGLGFVMEYCFLRQAFEVMKISRVRVRIRTDNTKVIRLHEKMGYIEVKRDAEAVDMEMRLPEWVNCVDRLDELVSRVADVSQVVFVETSFQKEAP